MRPEKNAARSSQILLIRFEVLIFRLISSVKHSIHVGCEERAAADARGRCQDDKDIFFSTWTQISLSSACPSTFMPLSGLIQMSPGGETKTLAFDPQIAGRGRRSQGLTPWGGRECRALKEHVWF